MEKRQFTENLGSQFELYKHFFRTSLKVDTFKSCQFSTNLRMPNGINDNLDNVRRFYERKLGILISKNDLIVMILTDFLNMKQEPNRLFIEKGNGQNIGDFLEEFEDELVQAVKLHLFNENMRKRMGK